MGDADAAFNLGRMHEWKQVQRRGDASALELQREIASEAAPGGRSGPGYSASEAAALARSWKEDAAYWHGVGCERGLTVACAHLGRLLRERGLPGDAATACLQYMRAAGAGDADSQWELVGMLTNGDGCARSLDAAEEWLMRAAQSGHPVALLQVGKHAFE